jgi:hypothetical protein
MANECCEDLMADMNVPGCLYIIQEDNTQLGTGQPQYFKVGISGNVSKRLQDLQTGNWRKLTMNQHKKVSNMSKAEKYAHNLLEPQKWNRGGGTEWFHGDYQVIKHAVDAAAEKYPGTP